jgi:hypothetical protein
MKPLRGRAREDEEYERLPEGFVKEEKKDEAEREYEGREA